MPQRTVDLPAVFLFALELFQTVRKQNSPPLPEWRGLRLRGPPARGGLKELDLTTQEAPRLVVWGFEALVLVENEWETTP